MGKEVPLEYVAVAAVYCVVYTLLAMLLALLLFEDRDLG
jgi:ABC-type transport system involved in multi-copper enzyme maturation permease subunit